jgi:hypothetical protein
MEAKSEQQRELTFGEKAVGVTFNPSQDPGVKRIKDLYAEIIDILEADRQTAMSMKNNKDYDAAGAARLYSIAITEAQAAQMWAVKARTWNI